MRKIRTVLCPTDFSPAAQRGSVLALQICRRFRSRLVYQHNLSFWALGEPLPESPLNLEGQQEAGAEQNLKDLVASAPRSLQVESRLTSGKAHVSILELARELPADLIVMGTSGRSGLDHLLIGSVTERVLVQAPVPVLTAKPVGRYNLFARAGMGEVAQETQVVVPVDFSSHSLETLEYAFWLADTLPVVIHLLHVIEPMSWDDMRGYSHFNVPEFLRHRMMDASDRLNSLIPGNARVRAEGHVRLGPVIEEIIGYAEMIQADLILMGAKPKGVVREALFGATSYGVLRSSSCPVWVVPDVGGKRWVSKAQGRFSETSPVPAEDK